MTKGIEAFELGDLTEEKLLDQMNPIRSYIAQDESGEIYSYNIKPHIKKEYGEWAFSSIYDSDKIGKGDPNPNWQNAIVKVRIKAEIVEDE